MVYEVRVKRENGDHDTLYLCVECLPSIDTFLAVVRKKRSNGRCDRCEGK